MCWKKEIRSDGSFEPEREEYKGRIDFQVPRLQLSSTVRAKNRAEKEELAGAIQAFLSRFCLWCNFERALGVVNGVKDIDSFREGIEIYAVD